MKIRTRKKFSLTLKADADFVSSALMFFLCSSISTYYIFQNPVITAVRYAVAVVCTIFALLTSRYISTTASAFFVCCAVSGALNILFIGNSTYPKLLYTLMSILIAWLLCNPRLSPQCLLYSMYLHALIVAYHFARYGLQVIIYAHSSNNYVSVLLLMPVTVYYSLLERSGQRIPVMPALTVFILSVLAMGRGGVISSAFLLLGVLFYSVFSKRAVHKIPRLIFAALFALLLLMCGLIFIYLRPSLTVTARFDELGVSDHGRFRIWTQYLQSAFEHSRYFWLGARFRDLPLVVHHENNLHNSFLNVHAFNGLITSIFLFCLCVYAVCYALRHKRTLFLICMASLYFRGFTDQMLWGTLGTPFIMYFFLTPQFEQLYRKSGKGNSKYPIWDTVNDRSKTVRMEGKIYEF